MASKKEESNYGQRLTKELFLSVATLIVVSFFFEKELPYSVFGFWTAHGEPKDWLMCAWPLFAWGCGVNIVVKLVTRNDPRVNRNAEGILIGGFINSTVAGLFEEILFRWLFFLSNIVWVKLGNWAFFGWAGFGIGRWLHLTVFGPIANFTTFHTLEGYLTDPDKWAIGAALLASNAFFRDGHRYQGLLGIVNSWCVGMFLFWVMFNYGLPAAILIHFTYDMLIYIVVYVDAAVERALGWT